MGLKECADFVKGLNSYRPAPRCLHKLDPHCPELLMSDIE
jgi:hypothetical protein